MRISNFQMSKRLPKFMPYSRGNTPWIVESISRRTLPFAPLASKADVRLRRGEKR